jgi:hypothetical protein
MNIRTPLKSEIFQYAWVVPSIEAAAQVWYDELGVGPFTLIRDVPVTEPVHRGGVSEARFSVALAMNGGVQIELIEQHNDVPSVYRDTVPKGATGFHHVAIIEKNFDKAVSYYTAAGHEIAGSGALGDVRHAYADTTAILGHMIEVVEDKESIRAIFAIVEQAHETWDKNRETLVQEMNPH